MLRLKTDQSLSLWLRSVRDASVNVHWLRSDWDAFVKPVIVGAKRHRTESSLPPSRPKLAGISGTRWWGPVLEPGWYLSRKIPFHTNPVCTGRYGIHNCFNPNWMESSFCFEEFMVCNYVCWCWIVPNMFAMCVCVVSVSVLLRFKCFDDFIHYPSNFSRRQISQIPAWLWNQWTCLFSGNSWEHCLLRFYW